MIAPFYYLRRYKTATLLHLLGLSMALAAFYLFRTQVAYNNTFNLSLKDCQRTYRVEKRDTNLKWTTVLPGILKDSWIQIPHVEGITVTSPGAQPLEIKIGERLFQTDLMKMDKNALDFWDIHLLPGSNSWKEQPDGYIISESLARQIFRKENPVGKKFSIPEWNCEDLTIIGVCQDFAENCAFKNGIFQCYSESELQAITEWNKDLYLRLDNSRNMKQTEQAIKRLFTERFPETSKDTAFQLRLIPMDRAYFEGSSPMDKGNKTLVHVLQAASVFILIIGLLNFTNFSLAQAPVRIRSINTRKVMGASTASLRWEMILENVFWSVIALVGAALLILLFQQSPECMKLVSRNISCQTHGLLAGITLLVTLGIGVLSALFSAWYATSFPPALVLKGSFGLSPRGKMLRWTMLTGQFVVAFILILFVLVITGQTHYIFNADYGFNKNEVLYAKLPNEAMSKKDSLRQEITRLPFAKNCSFAEPVLGSADWYMGWGRGSGAHEISFFALCVDEHFLKTMDIKIAAGRDFNQQDRKGAYILNQAMSRKYPWIKLGEPIGQNMEGWDNTESHYPVVGICENYRLTSMRNDNRTVPAAFIIMGPDMIVQSGDHGTNVFIRITKGYDKLEAKKQLEQLFKQLNTKEPCEFHFLDEDLQTTYKDEFRFMGQVKLFAFICIFITLVGVFCLTLFETEYRRKEIALRKIMGSSVHEVLLLFAGRYLIPLLAAFVIAAPMGYHISTKWLQHFAEHAPIYWWHFPVAFVLVSAVVLLTVVLQGRRTATENPVNSMKTE